MHSHAIIYVFNSSNKLLCVLLKKRKTRQLEIFTQLMKQMTSCSTMKEKRQTTRKRSLRPNSRMRVCREKAAFHQYYLSRVLEHKK